MNLIVLWVAVSLIAIIIDIITSNFFFVSFTCGGIAAIILYIIGGNISNQIIAFAFVSAVFMIVTFRISKKYLKKSVPKTLRMEETYIGREITVNEEIIEKALYKIDGIYWTIKNSGEELKKGDKAEITAIEGNKIIIKKRGDKE